MSESVDNEAKSEAPTGMARKAPLTRKKAEEDQPSLSQGLPSKRARLYGFTIPESARMSDNDPKKVILQELDQDALDVARRIARGNEVAASTEVVKAALYKVDGVEVNHAEEEATFLWARWSSKVRHLIQQGWAKVHVTTDEEDESFLSSMAIE